MGEPSFLRNSPSFFKVLMGDFTNQLMIPPAFVKNLGGLEGVFPKKYSISNSADRCWSVEINRVNSRLVFQNGWKQFVEDNSPEKGDFLVFRCWGSLELLVHMYGKTCCEKKVGFARDARRVRETETHLQICEVIDVDADYLATDVGRGKQNDRAEIAGGLGLEIKQRPLKIASQNRKRLIAAEAVKNFTSQYPHYRVVMKPTYIHSGRMYSPLCLRKCLKNHQIVKLQSSNKTWTAKFNVYHRCCMLSHGWAQFVRDNNLKVDDICIFEIINVDDVTLKVTIFR